MDKRNLLFMFADQMHAFALGCMGNEEVYTPHLDQLARDGVLFQNTYSNCPICTPYRGVLFSGKYDRQTGIHCRKGKKLPEDTISLATSLNEGGYRTSYVGKWHLGTTGNIAVEEQYRAGFQDFTGYQCYNDFLKNVWFFDEQHHKTEHQMHRTDATAEVVIDRLNEIKEEPFAMFVSFQNPHYPLQPSMPFERMYKNAKLTRRPNAVGSQIDPYTGTASPRSPQKELDPTYLRYGEDLDEYLRLYYAMVSQLDHNIGKIIAYLKDQNLYESTVIMFTSDHGDMQGSHDLINKTEFYEESTRVPLMVKVPDGLKQSVKQELIGTVDLYPTIQEFCGIEPSPELPGSSFAPIVFGKEQSWRNCVFSETKKFKNPEDSWYMVREDHYKLAVQQDTLEPTHLFDLERDPYEMVNLLGLLPDVTNRLLQRIKEWQVSYKPDCKNNIS